MKCLASVDFVSRQSISSSGRWSAVTANANENSHDHSLFHTSACCRIWRHTNIVLFSSAEYVAATCHVTS